MDKEYEKIEATFQFIKGDYPERKRTNIVITDDGDRVCIAVIARVRVYEKGENGCLNIHEEQWGDYDFVSKDAPVSCIFEKLKELLDKVPEVIDKTGDKA